ncbi:LOW QUALITY PROTEIN: uncharacterized protein Dvir_GJ12775 [Drosophila virilis]|uniref:Uncharacterized protein n=1 Tax=Drosophila virilis TaxID=7244 RepID=B4LI09_DROVI|nr:LOW QUALITY PROTEIN: uncharacterized protein Dvir_GJ12775 [Drosophila virilis]
MFKILFVLCAAWLALSQARPSYLPSYETIEYAPTVLGLPAAVSHQSSTVVHEKRPYLRPIYEHPLKTYHHPTTYTYASSPLSYGSDWYEPGWNTAALSYPSIYLK